MENRQVTININDITPTANTAYVDAGKDNKTYNKAQVNELVEDLREGTLGSISPSQTLQQLNALPDGNYYASEAGNYAFGVNVPVSWQYRFSKLGTDWKVLTKVEMPTQDLTQLENQALTYKVVQSNESVEKFKNLIKNIYINSSLSNISAVKLNYVGINDHARKLLIMLNINSSNGTFILDVADLRNLSGKVIELLAKEDDVNITGSTSLFIEFNKFENYPTESFLVANFSNYLELLPKSFNNYQSVENYNLTNIAVIEANLLKVFNLIENIYINDVYNRLNKENVSLQTIYINQYSEVRKIVLHFTYNNQDFLFYTEKTIIPNSKNVKLDIKETPLNGIDVYLDFKNFESYPTEEFNVAFLSVKFKLTENVFSNFELKTTSKIAEIESKIITKNNEINVSKSQGNNAIQLAINRIKDNSESNRYTINAANGVYAIHKKEDFIGNPGYPALICPIDYVNIKGQSKSSTIISADFDESIGDDTWMYQTIYNWANEVTISNITFIAKNLRYVLHQDNSKEANGTRYYENVDFIFLGKSGGQRALGTGTYSGSKTYVTGGKSQSQAFPTFTVHNNINFSKPSLWSFKGHEFEVLDSEKVVEIYNCGSNQDCEIYLENCSFSGSFIFSYQEYWLYSQNVNDHFNHANWRIKGSNNQPFYFKNTVIGSTICIETKTKTKDSKVRFDVNSSAYPILIKNNINNYFGNLGNPNRKIKDDYVIQDGANGIAGFAFGGKSILEQYYFPDNNSWTKRQDSLGIRLGDCSTINKVLGIIINNTTYNVTFNRNYTDFTNAQVIAEINSVIGSVATAKEYNIGKDYYAEINDVVMIGVNNSTTDIIPKGTLVTKIGNRIAPCGENDSLYGLLIDDLGAYELDPDGVIISKGRVINNCYVSLDDSNVSSVLFDSISARYKIVNGRFVADASGIYKAIDSKYILI